VTTKSSKGRDETGYEVALVLVASSLLWLARHAIPPVSRMIFAVHNDRLHCKLPRVLPADVVKSMIAHIWSRPGLFSKRWIKRSTT
jgi:hypothetical protein